MTGSVSYPNTEKRKINAVTVSSEKLKQEGLPSVIFFIDCSPCISA
jgi:hypothetical protein